MKKILPILTLSIVMAIPTYVQAQQITFTTELKPYEGKNAYLAMYLTNSAGHYQQTLWVSGGMARYYNHLRGWAQASGLKKAEYDGKTGATIASGKSYTVTLDVDDTFIDAGYQIHIDSAVEHNRDGRDDVVADLRWGNAGKIVSGKSYIQSFTYTF